MKALEQIAQEIARETSDIPEDSEAAIDPTMIFAIMQFLQDLFAECQKRSGRRRFRARRALRRAQNPGDFETGRAVEFARRHGFEGTDAHSIVQAAIVVFATVTVDQVKELAREKESAFVL